MNKLTLNFPDGKQVSLEGASVNEAAAFVKAFSESSSKSSLNPFSKTDVPASPRMRRHAKHAVWTREEFEQIKNLSHLTTNEISQDRMLRLRHTASAIRTIAIQLRKRRVYGSNANLAGFIATLGA